MFEKAPAGLVPVASINGVGKQAFLKMGSRQFEKCFSFDGAEVKGGTLLQRGNQFLLLEGIGLDKRFGKSAQRFGVQSVDPQPVGFQMWSVGPAQSPV